MTTNDKENIQQILTDMYDIVSGPEGYSRDWQREFEIFAPYANMIRTSLNEKGCPDSCVMNIKDYPDNFDRLMAGRAFYEFEIHNIIEVFGNIAHAFSTYEAWEDSDKKKFIKRGINSIQLFNNGDSWKIVNMIWDDERAGLSISKRYSPTQ